MEARSCTARFDSVKHIKFFKPDNLANVYYFVDLIDASTIAITAIVLLIVVTTFFFFFSFMCVIYKKPFPGFDLNPSTNC